MKRKIFAACAAVFTALPLLHLHTEAAAFCDWDFGYCHVLTEKAAEIYQQMAASFRALDFDISFRKSDGVAYEDVQQAVLTFFQNDPELFYIRSDMVAQESGNTITVDLKLQMPGEPDPQPVTDENIALLRGYQQALNEKADEILAGMPDGTDYAKSLYLHDYLIWHTSYMFSVTPDGRFTWDDQTAYGALVNGEAICNGFSQAYALLLRRAGLRATTVHGFGRGESHAWVMHEIDGECVYSDPTWDSTFRTTAPHDFFALSLAEMSEEHMLSDAFVRDIPACGHTGHHYIDRGDVNANGIVNLADAVLLIQILAEDPAAAVTDAGFENADTDRDSLLTAADAALLLRTLRTDA